MFSMLGTSDVRITDASSLSGFARSNSAAFEKRRASSFEINVSEIALVISQRQQRRPQPRIFARVRQVAHLAAIRRQRIR